MQKTPYLDCVDQHTPGHEHLWDYDIDNNVYVCTRRVHEEIYGKEN